MSDHAHIQDIVSRFNGSVIEPMKRSFVSKEEVVDLLGVCLLGGENLFILGPPGTAKSALVNELGRLIEGNTFDYLLTRFTEPSELFGPFDIRQLREGELVTNTEGMLPEASLAFLDEILNANSAILNSLLMVLNERVFRRGRETRKLPLLMTVGASNHLPEEDALRALFDRFLLRVRCDNVPEERLAEVLGAGWRLERQRNGRSASPSVSTEEIRTAQRVLPEVELEPIRKPFIDLIHKLRRAGIAVSDRRAVKLQRVIAASALMAGRFETRVSDLWVLRYIWDNEDQQEVIAEIVRASLEGTPTDGKDHPRAKAAGKPDSEEIAREVERISSALENPKLGGEEESRLRDQLALLAARCDWIENDEQRDALKAKVEAALT